MTLIFLLTTAHLAVAQDDTGIDPDSRCASGEYDDPGQYLGNGRCGAPIMAGYCAHFYGGECPHLDDFRDRLREPYGPYGYTGPCAPTDPVSFSANFSFNEGGTTYYFDQLGVLVGEDSWVGLGSGCCEGREVYDWSYGVTGPCTPWDPRKMKLPGDGSSDAGGCGGGCAGLVGVLGLTRALRRRR
jgi:hypothetical protein